MYSLILGLKQSTPTLCIIFTLNMTKCLQFCSLNTSETKLMLNFHVSEETSDSLCLKQPIQFSVCLIPLLYRKNRYNIKTLKRQ